MVYNPATDFLGLWRLVGGVSVAKAEMPALDLIISALARAGLITLSVSATPPLANQSTTAWLQAAIPSYTAEGVFRLWDKVTTTYLPATPALFNQFLEACNNDSGVSWWTTTLGPPANVVGSDGDFAIRTDEPGGIYGPKVVGAWPVNALPGTTNVLTSTELDNTFGAGQGTLIVRGAAQWAGLAAGAPNMILNMFGLDPLWSTLSALLDAIFSNAQGSILYRGAGAWAALGPGVLNQILASGGPGGDPSWAPRTAEFPSGTKMLFQQTAAPTGWTKQVTLNDYGLRVVSGTVGSVAGSAFSTVFAQTAVGNHTVTVAEMPSHTHPYQVGSLAAVYAGGGNNALGNNVVSNTGAIGGDGPHTHSVQLTLSYVDVIIASKD